MARDDPHVTGDAATTGADLSGASASLGSAPVQNGGGAGDAALGGNGLDHNAGQSTPETQKVMLKEALYYASKGVHVFPSPPGTKKSYKSMEFSNGRPWGMTTDATEIKKDWKDWPAANVCIVTGPARTI